MIDNLKNTMIKMLKNKVGIDVVDVIIEKETPVTSYPKMLVKSCNENKVEVIDYKLYDEKGQEVHPVLQNIIGLNILEVGTSNKSKILDYSEGVVTLENSLSLNEYISELIIDTNEVVEENKDYLYISSLHTMSKRLNYSTKEYFRRFELALFVYNDSNQSKCSSYMEKISDTLDRDFNIYDDKGVKVDTAYIFNPLKFTVEENGKINRVLYGSIMIKTIRS